MPHYASIKAIFFDLDDTLVNTIGPKWAQHKHIAKTYYGKDLSDAEIRTHWGKPLSTLMQLLYETSDAATALSYNTLMRPHFPKQLFDFTLETLQHLKSQGKKIGLVTATTRSNVLYDFERMQFPNGLFDYVQTEEDTASHKPDPEVFKPALEFLKSHQIQPHETLYVGDHLNDMRAATGAGMQFVGVATGLFSLEEFAKHNTNATAQVSDLRAWKFC